MSCESSSDAKARGATQPIVLQMLARNVHKFQFDLFCGALLSAPPLVQMRLGAASDLRRDRHLKRNVEHVGHSLRRQIRRQVIAVGLQPQIIQRVKIQSKADDADDGSSYR